MEAKLASRGHCPPQPAPPPPVGPTIASARRPSVQVWPRGRVDTGVHRQCRLCTRSVYMCTREHMCTHTCTRKRAYTHVHTCTHGSMLVCTHARMHTCTHVNMRTHVCTQARTARARPPRPVRFISGASRPARAPKKVRVGPEDTRQAFPRPRVPAWGWAARRMREKKAEPQWRRQPAPGATDLNVEA